MHSEITGNYWNKGVVGVAGHPVRLAVALLGPRSSF
jgi:hypothetical protein